MVQQRILVLFCVFLGATLTACGPANKSSMTEEERAMMRGAPASIEEYAAIKEWRAAGSPVGEPMDPNPIVITDEQREEAAALKRLGDEYIAKQNRMMEQRYYRDEYGKTIMRRDMYGNYYDSSGKFIMREDGHGSYVDENGKDIMRETTY